MKDALVNDRIRLALSRLLIRVPLDEMDREQAARSARLAPPMFRSLVFI
jgi:hypothetical protein